MRQKYVLHIYFKTKERNVYIMNKNKRKQEKSMYQYEFICR